MIRLPASALLFGAILLLPPHVHSQVRSIPQPNEDVRQMLQKFIGYAPDPCNLTPKGEEKDWDTSQIEAPLFQRVSDLVADALNTGTRSPTERATKTLRDVEGVSAEVNSAWPRENQFHFEVLDLNEILVVEMSIRMRGRFVVYSSSQGNEKNPDHLWRKTSLLNDGSDTEVPWVQLSISPLHRGPSGRPRFLVRSVNGGCAGSIGIAYDAREWNSENDGSADQIVSIKGALGLDDKVAAFPQIGELRTKGPLIDLPYCWWSPIDTWDNPSMCAVDRYDLSTDAVRFVSRRVNRPDLLPVAQALDYSNKRDFGAVRGYCVSDAVARRLVEWAPGRLFDTEVKVKRLGTSRELVFDDSGNYRFTVEKRGARWLIAAFAIN